jgi:protease I
MKNEKNKRQSLDGLRVAILVTVGFEQVEMTEPRHALDAAGARTTLITPTKDKIKAWQHTDWGDEFTGDKTLDEVDPGDFDALLLPGGVMNPDKLRMNPDAVSFVKAFVDEEKPVAAICHGPWLLVEVEGARGRKLTSWPSIKTDLINAGAEWVDEEAVRDGMLVTSRKPDDIPAFNKAMIALFSEAVSATAAA